MRRVREDLSALFGSIGRPGISTFVCWGCAALACPLATRGGYAGAVGAAIVFSLSVLILAYLLGSGALAFVNDAKRSCLPGSQRLAWRAMVVTTALLLPAIVLTVTALAGSPVWPAWAPSVLVLATALAGALASRRPAFGAGLFLLAVLTARWAASGRGETERGKEWFVAFLGTAIVLLAAAIPLLAAVKWRRIIGLGSGATGFAERIRTIGASRRRSWQPQAPAQIVRTCLGAMFVQPSRPLIIGAALMALLIVTGIGLPRPGASDARWAVIVLALLAGGLISSGFLTQLPNLTRGQIAELALMPGLGAPPAQRRALCRAALAPPLPWLGMVLLLGSADLLLNREPLSSVGMLAVGLFILWLNYTVFALQKLAALPAKRQSFISEFLMLCLFVYASGAYYWVYTANPHFRLWFWFWVSPVLFCIGVASAIGFSLRRLATAPHPFLS